MRMKSLWITALAAALAACGGGDNNQTGSLSLGVTDAPVDDADAVVVTFTGVELLNAAGEAEQTFTLTAPQQIDLLTLQGTNSEFLVEGQEVPVGQYEEVRLIIDSPSCGETSDLPSYITVDGTNYPLFVPSGASSGLKVKGPITVAAGGSAAYVVDFDLRKSIAERGNTNCYNLRPVLRVVDVAEVGTLSGTVDGELLAQAHCTNTDITTGEGAAVYIYSGADVTPDDVDDVEPEPLTTALLTAKNDNSGDFSYEAGFLLAGDYTASFTCNAGDDDPEANNAGEGSETTTVQFSQTANVVIQADTVTTQDFVLSVPTQ